MGVVLQGFFGKPREVVETGNADAQQDDAIAAELAAVAQQVPVAPVDQDYLNRLEEELVMTDVYWMIGNTEHLDSVRERMNILRTFLFTTLRFSESSAVIGLARRDMRFLPLGDISKQALDTCQAHWMANPGYFAALVLEHHDREERAMRAFSISQ